MTFQNQSPNVYRARKGAGYTRRIRAMLTSMSLPHWSRRRMLNVVDMLCEVKGDGINDTDLRVIVRLGSRGMFDNYKRIQS